MARSRGPVALLRAVLALGALLCAAPVLAGIVGSSHDLSGETWSDGEICSPCHTPHNADSSVTGAPLWNHDMSSATYTTYSSATMSTTVGTPGAESLVCLSCHDGTVALDSFGGTTGTTTITGDANLSNDLSDDHPIGFDWAHQTEIPSCSNCHFSTRYVNFFGRYRIECATCHDVHDDDGNPGMLVLDNSGSWLCLQCHGK